MHILRHRPIKPDLEQIKQLKDKLCELRLDLTKLVSSKKWLDKDLDKEVKGQLYRLFLEMLIK